MRLSVGNVCYDFIEARRDGLSLNFILRTAVILCVLHNTEVKNHWRLFATITMWRSLWQWCAGEEARPGCLDQAKNHLVSISEPATPSANGSTQQYRDGRSTGNHKKGSVNYTQLQQLTPTGEDTTKILSRWNFSLNFSSNQLSLLNCLMWSGV